MAVWQEDEFNAPFPAWEELKAGKALNLPVQKKLLKFPRQKGNQLEMSFPLT